MLCKVVAGSLSCKWTGQSGQTAKATQSPGLCAPSVRFLANQTLVLCVKGQLSIESAE